MQLIAELKKLKFREVKKSVRIGKNVLKSNGISTLTLTENGSSLSESYLLPKYGVIICSDKRVKIVDCLNLTSLMEEVKNSHKIIDAVICDGKIFVKSKKQ